MKKISVLGAGSWGTALALVLADNHHDVHMWGHRQELIDQINEKHENHDYLPNVALPASIQATTDMKQSLEGTDAIIVAVPTKAIREVLKQAMSSLRQRCHLFMSVKELNQIRFLEFLK